MYTTSERRLPLSKKIRAHIELADPVTWISPSIVVVCGALASGISGGFDWRNPQHWALAMLGALMAGPLGTGFSQSINDYFDRDLDAINDPARPIPAGLITLNEARGNWLLLGTLTFAVSLLFGRVEIVIFAVLGLILSVIYSMPPIKLKRNYWLGPPAVGIGYVSMSWLAGHVIFAPLTWQSLLVAVINGGLAAGMLFLNDIKSVEGDRRHGLVSLPVAIGVRPTLIIAYLAINGFELMLMTLALWMEQYLVAGFIAVAVLLPIYNQIQLFREPNQRNYVRYMLASNPFVALIQFVSAFLVGGYFG
jgi:chlorophyll synthase